MKTLIKKLSNRARLKGRVRAFGRSERGGMLVETAMGVSFLIALMIGVTDFGLAYARQMAMSNAVRSGSQLALVRHPSLDPSANQTDAHGFKTDSALHAFQNPASPRPAPTAGPMSRSRCSSNTI